MASYAVFVMMCLAVTNLSPGAHCRRPRYGRYLYPSATGLNRRAPDGLEADVDDRVLNDQLVGSPDSSLTQTQPEPVEPNPDPEDPSLKRSYRNGYKLAYNPSRSLSRHKSNSDPSRFNPSRSLSTHTSNSDPSRYNPSRSLSTHTSNSDRFGTSRGHGTRHSRHPGHSKRTFSRQPDRATDLDRMRMPYQKRTSGDEEELDTLNGADETNEDVGLTSDYMNDYIAK